MGRVRMPDGKRIAVNLGADFDAQAIWLGSFNMPIQSLMHRGQFGAEVGLPRLLEVWERYGEMTSVFAPGTRSTPSPRSCVAWSMPGTRSDTTGTTTRTRRRSPVRPRRS
jgi:hypothetical protein